MEDKLQEKTENQTPPTDYLDALSQAAAHRQRLHTEAATPRGLKLVLLAWLLGALCWELWPMPGMGLAVPLLTVALYALVLWYSGAGRRLLRPASLGLLAPIALLAASFVLVDSFMANFITIAVLLVLIAAHLAELFGYAGGAPFSPPMVRNTLTLGLGGALQNLHLPPQAFRAGWQRRQRSNRSKVLLGVLCALPLVLAFLALFSAADARFAGLLRVFFQGSNTFWQHLIGDGLFGAVLGLLIAAWLLAQRTAQPAATPSARFAGVDTAVLAAFLGTINVVQVLFAALQFGYLFERPDAATVTEHARSGFFELCWAVALAAVIIGVVLALCRKQERGRPPLLVALSLSLLILCNYVLFASAIQRMLLYIQQYDLTIKRVATMWLMSLLALGFACALGRIWWPRLPLLRCLAGCVVAMTLALNALNPDVWIARFNIDAALRAAATHTAIHPLDLDNLADLAPASAVEVARLLQNPARPQDEALVRDILAQQQRRIQHQAWHSFKLTDAKVLALEVPPAPAE